MDVDLFDLASVRQLFGAFARQAFSYGRAAPAIARRLAEAGARRPPAFAGARNWVWLLRKLPTLRTRAGRVRWVVVGCSAVGRIAGSVHARTLML